MPHIPEEELHAYLDQALSRSQCVEIERHLADCADCRATRDGIAALRDRTTALLAVLAPPLTLPPAWGTLGGLHRAADSRRQLLIRRAIVAASLIGAVALGWSARVWQDTRNELSRRPATAEIPSTGGEAAPTSSVGGAGTPTLAQSPQVLVRQAPDTTGPSDAAEAEETDPPEAIAVYPPGKRGVFPGPYRSAPAEMAEATTDTITAEAIDTAPAFPAPTMVQRRIDTRPEPDGLWRLVDVASAEEESGVPLPVVAGLPVMQVKIQGVSPNERIVAVDQQLATGEVIRTIGGPAGPVSDLLRRQGGAVASAFSSETMVQFRQGDRMIAITGRLPTDSLRALLVRLPIPSVPERVVPHPTQAVPQISPSP